MSPRTTRSPWMWSRSMHSSADSSATYAEQARAAAAAFGLGSHKEQAEQLALVLGLDLTTTLQLWARCSSLAGLLCRPATGRCSMHSNAATKMLVLLHTSCSSEIVVTLARTPAVARRRLQSVRASAPSRPSSPWLASAMLPRQHHWPSAGEAEKRVSLLLLGKP